MKRLLKNPFIRSLCEIGLTITTLFVVYIFADFKLSATVIENMVEETSQVATPINSKQQFEEVMYVKAELNAKPITDTYMNLYDGNISISSTDFTESQIRLNKEAYSLTAKYFTEEHLSSLPSKDTTFYKSVMEIINPLVPMSFTAIEKGGSSDASKIFATVVHTKELDWIGADWSKFNISDYNTTYVESNNIMTYSNGDKVPLNGKAHNVHQTSDMGSYKCTVYDYGTDMFKWEDLAHRWVHHTNHYATSTWNKDYSVSSVYELVALWAIAHNTGPGYLSQGSTWYSNTLQFPWKSSKAIFDYCADLTSAQNLQVILNYADNDYEKIVESIKSGNTGVNFQMDLNEYQNNIYPKLTFAKTGLDDYMRDGYHGFDENSNCNSETGDEYMRQVRIRTGYAVQAIYAYRVLELLYTSGGE